MKPRSRATDSIVGVTNKGILTKWSTSKKTAAGFSLALVFLVIMCLVAYGNTLGFISATNSVQHSQQVLNELQNTLSTMINSETGIGGYFITGDKTYLATYNSAIARIDGQVEHLKALTTNNPSQQSRIPILSQAIATRLNVLSERIKERGKEGFDPAQPSVLTVQGKISMDTIRKVIAEMQAEENGILRAKQIDSNESARNTLLTLTSLVLIVSTLLWLVYYLIKRDITKQARAMEAIRESELKYRQLMEQASDGIIVMDQQANFIEANSRMCAMLGYTREEMLQLTARDIIEPGDLAGTPLQIEALRSGKTVEGPWLLVRKDGTVFPSESSVKMLEDSRIQSIVRDVTERKRAEEEMRESERRLAGILEIAEDAIISIDEAQHITLFNQGAEKIFGYTAKEVIGQPLDILLPSRFAPSHGKHIANFARTDGVARKMGERRELAGRRKDGTEFPAEASISKLELGKEIVFTVMLRDVTERKQAEETLRISEERNRTLLASLPHRVFFKDRNLVIASVNSLFAEELGMRPEDVVGKTDYDLTSQALADKYRADDMRIMETRQPEVLEEINVVAGTERVVEIVKAPVISDDNEVMGVLGLFTDITDRKRIEASLRDDAALLASIVQTQSDIAANKLDRNSLMTFIAERAQQLTGAGGAVIELADGDEMVSQAASVGAMPHLGLRLKIGSSLTGICFRTGEMLRCDDAETDSRVDIEACRKANVRSMIVVPLQYDRKIIGVLKVFSHEAHKFDDRTVNTLQLMAGLIAAAMAHASEFEAKKIAMAALQESEARFRAAKDGSLDAFFLYKCVRDEQGKIIDFVYVDVNAHAEARLNKSREELIGKTMRDVYPSVQTEGLLDSYLKVYESGQAIEMELQVKLPDLSVQWVYQQIVPLADGIAITSRDITERKRAEGALQESEARFRATIEGSLDAFFLFQNVRDDTGRIIDFTYTDLNSRGEKLHGKSRAELLGNRLCEVFPFLRADGHFDRYVDVFVSGATSEEEAYTTPPGKPGMWAFRQIVPLSDGVAITIRDITERKRAEDTLRETEERYSSVIAALEEGVVLQNADGSISAINNSAEHVLGLTAGQMLGLKSFYTQLLAIHEDGSPFPDKDHPARRTLRTGKPCSNVVMGIQKPNGERAWLSINSQPLTKPGERKPYAVVSSFTDITERKRAEQVLLELAIRDDLTGLYNRREMDRLLKEEIKRYHRYNHPVSLAMLDIDHFKEVNDTYGHPIGDEVLKWVATLLQENVRDMDRLARYGGEEFALILPETPEAEALLVAERIRQAVAARVFVFEDESQQPIQIPVTVSLGVVSISLDTSTDDDDLVAAADAALYEAKRQGRNRIVVSTSTLSMQEPNLVAQ